MSSIQSKLSVICCHKCIVIMGGCACYSLGGLNDSSLLLGTGSAYLSQPGRYHVL